MTAGRTAARECREYFRHVPGSDFLVWRGASGMAREHPEGYAKYVPGIDGYNTFVVKVGTSVISHKHRDRTDYVMRCLAEDLSALRSRSGKNVMLVTSGACALGRQERLKAGQKTGDIAYEKRKDAGVGQPILMEMYRSHFGGRNQTVAQSLVTHMDLQDARVSKGLLEMYKGLMHDGTIPIINEDDLRSPEEIEDECRLFRDNDGLSGLVATSMHDGREYRVLFVMLTDQRGIRPKSYFERGRPDAVEEGVIRVVTDPEGLDSQAVDSKSGKGRGGALSKIMAFRETSMHGIYGVCANGLYCNFDAHYQRHGTGERLYRPFDAILEGRCIGTRFLPL